MKSIADLLDEARKASGLASDNALAKRLGTTRQVVSQWRHGDSYPGEEKITALAHMARADAGEWLVRVQAARSDGNARRHWEDIAKRLGIAAAIALCAVGTAIPLNLQAAVPDSVSYVPLLVAVAMTVGTILVRRSPSPFGGNYA